MTARGEHPQLPYGGPQNSRSAWSRIQRELKNLHFWWQCLVGNTCTLRILHIDLAARFESHLRIPNSLFSRLVRRPGLRAQWSWYLCFYEVNDAVWNAVLGFPLTLIRSSKVIKLAYRPRTGYVHWDLYCLIIDGNLVATTVAHEDKLSAYSTANSMQLTICQWVRPPPAQPGSIHPSHILLCHQLMVGQYNYPSKGALLWSWKMVNLSRNLQSWWYCSKPDMWSNVHATGLCWPWVCEVYWITTYLFCATHGTYSLLGSWLYRRPVEALIRLDRTLHNELPPCKCFRCSSLDRHPNLIWTSDTFRSCRACLFVYSSGIIIFAPGRK